MSEVADRISLYQPKQKRLKFATMPTFKSYVQKRQHRKERLIAACRAFTLHGFDYSFEGHLTLYNSEFPNLYWSNPMAVHFSQVKVKVSNLILTDHKGEVVKGDYALNRAGFVWIRWCMNCTRISS